jgi:hypothetical protein
MIRFHDAIVDYVGRVGAPTVKENWTGAARLNPAIETANRK